MTTSLLGFLPVGLGTQWACPESNLDVFVKLLRGQSIMTLGNKWDWLVCGRGCVVDGGAAKNTLSTSGLRAAAKLFTDPAAVAMTDAFADRLDGKPIAVSLSQLGAFAFPRSDYLVVRRSDWAASWKGHSCSTIPARCVNGDSKMSANTGEGATFVYRSAEEGMAHADTWPVIDWEQYPGITSEQGNLQPCAWEYTYTSCSDVVGSVTDGVLGASTQFLAQNGGLTARRSWLFDESGVTSVVSHVGGTNATVVMTTVANQRLDGPVVVTLTNGSSHTCVGNVTFNAADVMAVTHNRTVYQTTSAAPGVGKGGGLIHIEAGPRSGDYSRISTHAKPVTIDVFRLSFEHTPVDPRAPPRGALEGFGYSVLPNAPTDAPPAVKLWVSDTGHAVSNESSGAVAVALWQSSGGIAPTPAMVGGSVRADSPCLLLLRRSGLRELVLAASWPEANVSSLVTVDVREFLPLHISHYLLYCTARPSAS
jgi:hypothetical protein